MMKRLLIYESKKTNPFYNLAWEQYLMEKKEKGDLIVFLWQNDNTVVIGRYQNLIEEVDISYVRENNIKIVRRNSGGGAVYHDIGNLNFSFIVDDYDEEMLKYCNDVLGAVLTSIGLNWQFDGRNDISVNGYKISGTARYISGGKILHHGTLLIDSNLNVLTRVLTRNTKILCSKSIKSVYRKTININDLVSMHFSVDFFKKMLEHEFSKNRIYDKGIISKADDFAIKRLSEVKYSTEKWNNGFAPRFNYRKLFKFDSGTVCLSVWVEDSVVKSIKFTGDFFASGDIEEFENILLNTKITDNLLELIKINKGDNMICGLTSENINYMIDDVIRICT